jgi:hypothetical protein
MRVQLEARELPYLRGGSLVLHQKFMILILAARFVFDPLPPCGENQGISATIFNDLEC